MPRATANGVAVPYRRAGDGEAVAFVPTLGYGPWQWSWQVPAVAGPFEAIVPVLRGTGAPDGTGAGSGPDAHAAPSDVTPADVATLAGDLEAVLADAGARRAHLVGFGLGGHVALEHAVRYDRARSLVMIGTTPGAPEGALPTDVVERLHAPRADRAALGATLGHVLSAEFRERHPDVVEGVVEWRAGEDATIEGWRAQAQAFEDWRRDWEPFEVDEPALVLHGSEDRVVPPENAEILGEVLPRTAVEVFEGAGHLVTVERSRPLNDRLVGFLESHAGD